MPSIVSIRLFLLYTVILLFINVHAQLPLLPAIDSTSDGLIVQDIVVTGNRLTKESVILREVLFSIGDTIQPTGIIALMETSTENILKTSLFHRATIDLVFKGDSVSFIITVTERWYWWIWPMLEYPDRNFNDWWQHRDLTRLSAGLFFQHENAGGRMEKLNIKAMAGYRTYLEASYVWPYINRSKSVGIGLFTSYSTQHEINYATENNKQLFYQAEQIMLNTKSISANLHFRPGTNITHYLNLQYFSFQLNDSIRHLNPEYLSSSETEPQFFKISYLLKADYRDNRAYPLKGLYLETELAHLSSLVEYNNQQSLRSSLRGYLPLTRKLYAASEFTFRLTNPEIKPYYLQNALGFDRNYVRGYEYMVIEGPHYWIFKTHAKLNILPLKTILIPFIKSEKFNTIPLSIYAGPHLDAGQTFPAINPIINPLQKKLLIGYGFGIDFVTYYDKVVRCEYTFRHKGASGLFIHFMATI